MPQQEAITADLLCMSGLAVSVVHMMWLLKELVYFVRNPLPVLSLMGPVRFRTFTGDKMYLIRLYKLADFLCMPEEVLNSIALACFECFFLTDNWGPETLNYPPLERHVQALWTSFVQDYEMCFRQMYTSTDYVNSMYSERVRSKCALVVKGDIYNVFGTSVHQIAKRVRAKETLATYDLSHYIMPHEATYTMDHILPILGEMCFNINNNFCNNIGWLRNNVETFRKERDALVARLAQATAEGHDHTVCDCENCLATHINCFCEHHRAEHYPDDWVDEWMNDYQEPNWEYMAELNWERDHGGW